VGPCECGVDMNRLVALAARVAVCCLPWVADYYYPNTNPAKAFEYVSPNNLARLASTVREFLSRNENGAVTIEGLEYLNTQNDFKSVLKFIQLIDEQVVLDKGYLLIPVDKATMETREFSLVEREMSQVI
jgi:hypothetical protein